MIRGTRLIARIAALTGLLCAALCAAATQQPSLDELIDAMGAESYELREQAMAAIVERGRSTAAALEQRLAVESDPEIRHRLRYVLAAILPPDQAVLIIRAWADCGLKPGDILTHIDHRRVRRPSDLARFARNAARGRRLRISASDGPRDLAEFNLEALLNVCEYRAPRGEAVARAVRLYATGYAEQAYELLKPLLSSTPPGELPPHLRALIAHTGGHESEALSLLQDEPRLVQPTDAQLRPWHSPSTLDLSGPLKAPYRLESVLWGNLIALDSSSKERNRHRDRYVQRVLVPANRLVDAMLHASRMWHHEFRNRLAELSSQDDLVAPGNMLAVTAWMLSDIGLLSECIDLIGPRSAFLDSTWVRVQLRAWKTFLAGQPRAALDEVYEDAREIMTKFKPSTVLIRNTDIAAQIAFFLYQMPDDPRVGQMLEIVTGDATNPGYHSLTHYARWMSFSIQSDNAALVTEHFATVIPQLPEGDAAAAACSLTMLQYAADRPDLAAMKSVRDYVERSQDLADRDAWLAACDAMYLLAQDKPVEASAALRPFQKSWIVRSLLSTANFRAKLPPAAAVHAQIKNCLLAVPVGKRETEWLVLTRGRKLVRFDAAANRLTPLDAPTQHWYPGPVNWPWLDRDESSGRVWSYGRRRVLELCRDEAGVFRANIDAEDIPDFARHVAPVFERLAEATASATLGSGERSEFLRSEIKAGHDYMADPDLPEIGLIEVMNADPRILQIAMRGGPHLIVERATGRTWSSQWIGDQLDLPAPPTFFTQAVPQQPEPVLILTSDQGVIRFDLAGEKTSRIALPGDDAYPNVVPESTPYVRRDPRWAYCARMPAVSGAAKETDGRVYRILLSDNTVEEVDMINVGLPAAYYDVQSRSDIRGEIDARLRAANIPPLQELIVDVRRAVTDKYPDKFPKGQP